MAVHQTANAECKRSLANTTAGFVLALAAGCVTWGYIQYVDPNSEGVGLFKVPEEFHIRALGESAERWSAYLKQQDRVDLKNAALVIGMLGAGMGAAMLLFWPPQVFFRRLFVGLFLGFLVGAIAGIAASLLQQRFEKSGQISVDQSAYVNVLLFGILGLGLGAMIGGASGSLKSAFDRGVVGLILGVSAGFAYPMIAYFLMANANIEELIPKAKSVRTLWLGVGCSLISLLLPWDAWK